MTKSNIEAALSNKVEGLNIVETKTSFTATFKMVSRINDMNKIGRAFRNKFPNNEIGWSGDWIMILKTKGDVELELTKEITRIFSDEDMQEARQTPYRLRNAKQHTLIQKLDGLLNDLAKEIDNK